MKDIDDVIDELHVHDLEYMTTYEYLPGYGYKVYDGILLEVHFACKPKDGSYCPDVIPKKIVYVRFH